MKINKKILFIPILGFGYIMLLTLLEHNRKDERLKLLAIFYHSFFIVITDIIGQHIYHC